MSATFDGENLLIILPSVGTFDVEIDLYSDWKEWSKDNDNLKYPIAFDTTGGDDIGGGGQIAAYFFLRNDLGWRIKPAEMDGFVDIQGNLKGRDPDLGVFVQTTGHYTVTITTSFSANAVVLTSDGENPIDAGDIWDESSDEHLGSGTYGAEFRQVLRDLRNLIALTAANLK
jgi:hypothetical protein